MDVRKREVIVEAGEKQVGTIGSDWLPFLRLRSRTFRVGAPDEVTHVVTSEPSPKFLDLFFLLFSCLFLVFLFR